MNELSLLDSLFGNDGFTFPSVRNAYMTPKVDVLQKKDSYVLCMDLPGKTEDDVEITLKNDVLTIANSEKKAEEKADENKDIWLIRERTAPSLKFRRTFTLPKDIDPAKVTASFKNGVLSIEIGRKEEAQEQKIRIVAA
ncbi:Hsp20/alpha crystallin family protein [Treponema sp.]|uniref:Hsp20/alpha crystallin family protein n=1 Tax=Treponema sp. TaxID=166 RepID=UPI00298DA38C|nr:Hsp20/alpha crystallin family protein [Treponema sp.]MCQ2241880.1 Hsp20/alpha crystallin family protein [Treponema sp.]